MECAAIDFKVGWQIIHHATREWLFTFEVITVDFINFVNAGRFEVVTQAKSVANFVTDQVCQQWSDERLGHAVKHLLFFFLFLLIVLLVFILVVFIFVVILVVFIVFLFFGLHGEHGHSHHGDIETTTLGGKAGAVDLAVPINQTVQRFIAHEACFQCTWFLSSMALRSLVLKLLADKITVRRICKANPRVPVWMFLEPRKCFSRHSVHRDFWH